ARELGLGSRDVVVAVTTLAFDIAVLELHLPLMRGARIALAKRKEAKDGSALAAMARADGATVLQATPATWGVLVESDWRATDEFKPLVGGEALRGEVARELILRHRVTPWNMYGPTETTVWSTWARIGQAERVSIGRPISNTRVYLLDCHGEPAP